jgi:hypothetical protein
VWHAFTAKPGKHAASGNMLTPLARREHATLVDLAAHSAIFYKLTAAQACALARQLVYLDLFRSRCAAIATGR